MELGAVDAESNGLADEAGRAPPAPQSAPSSSRRRSRPSAISAAVAEDFSDIPTVVGGVALDSGPVSDEARVARPEESPPAEAAPAAVSTPWPGADAATTPAAAPGMVPRATDGTRMLSSPPPKPQSSAPPLESRISAPPPKPSDAPRMPEAGEPPVSAQEMRVLAPPTRLSAAVSERVSEPPPKPKSSAPPQGARASRPPALSNPPPKPKSSIPPPKPLPHPLERDALFDAEAGAGALSTEAPSVVPVDPQLDGTWARLVEEHAETVLGEAGRPVAVLREAVRAAERATPAERTQARLALAIALVKAGRAREALLEALEALQGARAAADPMAERASARLIAQLARSSQQLEVATAWEHVARTELHDPVED